MDPIEALTLLRACEPMYGRAVDAAGWARVLATFPLFADVRRRRLRKLARHAAFAEFAQGETVIAREEADDSLYVVLEGSAKAIGGPASRSISIGDYFGELSLIGEQSPYGVVIAAQPLYVMRFPRRSVVRLARQHPAFTVTLLRDLAGRFELAERVRAVSVEPR